MRNETDLTPQTTVDSLRSRLNGLITGLVIVVVVASLTGLLLSVKNAALRRDIATLKTQQSALATNLASIASHDSLVYLALNQRMIRQRDSLATRLVSAERRATLASTAATELALTVQQTNADLDRTVSKVENLIEFTNELDVHLAQFDRLPVRVDSLGLAVTAVGDQLALVRTSASNGIAAMRHDLRRRDWSKISLWSVELVHLSASIAHWLNHPGR